MTVPKRFLDSLKVHEGLKLKPYQDTVGKLTIGYGRNLDDNGISELEASMLLMNDAYDAWDTAERLVSMWASLNEVRQSVLAEMVFNLGETRLRGFKRVLEAVDALRYGDAAKEMRSSLWATQVGHRAETLAKRMATGKW